MSTRQRFSLLSVATIAVAAVLCLVGLFANVTPRAFAQQPHYVLQYTPPARPAVDLPVLTRRLPEPSPGVVEAAPTATAMAVAPQVFWPSPETLGPLDRRHAGAANHHAAHRHRSSRRPLRRPSQPSARWWLSFIVGPSNETEQNLKDGEEFAQRAEKYGMVVRRVYHPHATWANVVANIQGANLVAYFGHGNGWPSPYGPFQERTKNGLGLDSYDGAPTTDMRYYGAALIRRHVELAPNAIVALNHLCYSAGNGEPGMEISDVGHRRAAR